MTIYRLDLDRFSDDWYTPIELVMLVEEYRELKAALRAVFDEIDRGMRDELALLPDAKLAELGMTRDQLYDLSLTLDPPAIRDARALAYEQ